MHLTFVQENVGIAKYYSIFMTGMVATWPVLIRWSYQILVGWMICACDVSLCTPNLFICLFYLFHERKLRK